jgi:hypothetical protein
MLDKRVFGYDNKTMQESEDVEAFFSKTIVKFIVI